MRRCVEIYDTTLRDGTQAESAALSVEDKLRVIGRLDALGVSYIEAGYPASNAKDAEVFRRAAQMRLEHAKLVAFSMACRKGVAPSEDPAMTALVQSGAPCAAIVGKAARDHVLKALETSLEENLRMIRESVAFAVSHGMEVVFDAEHFFDGYKADRDYALEVLLQAGRAGASRLALCDTNGGQLPHEVGAVVRDAAAFLEREGVPSGIAIHCHNDSGLAVANSIEAVRAGAVQVQGTVNGYGERVGNADLVAVVANLELKMGYRCIGEDNCRQLTGAAHFVADVFNRSLEPNRPFVGSSAFAHKGGLHVSALARMPFAYEHIDPASVGNGSHIVVSELSGKSSIIAKCAELGIDLADEAGDAAGLLSKVKALEAQGYSFELADASLELLFRRAVGQDISIFRLESYRVISDKRQDGSIGTEATIKIHVGDERFVATGEGNGPVNALDTALRIAITRFYPQVADISLSDFKVRVLDESSGTDAVTRVIIESRCGQRSWVTIGVHENIIEASWIALVDSLAYGLAL